MTASKLRRAAACVLGSALSVATLTGASVADAQTSNPYERGPAPTESSVTARTGPFATATTTVSSTAAGRAFGGGTIYYPTATDQGTFGAVAISPGFTARQSSISWLGPRLASQGFVVFTIDTNSTSDQPSSRGTQLNAALDHLVSSSRVASRVDRNRLGVMGHSMGGGGSLSAAQSRPSLKAAIPLAGWHTQKTWSRVEVPTLVVGAENDNVASVRSHSIPFYQSLGGEKAYLELAGASHFAPNSSNTTIARYSISWLKRFVDNDTRYDQFLCGPNHEANRSISQYEESCPYPGGSGGGSTPTPTPAPAPEPAPAPTPSCSWWQWWQWWQWWC